MRKFFAFLLVLLCLLNCGISAMAEETVTADCGGMDAPNALASTDDHSCNAAASILYELDAGTMAYAMNADMTVEPSELALLMTLLVAAEYGQPEAVVTVQQETLGALPEGVKIIGLQPGEELTVDDLCHCIMLASAGDAAAVLAEYIAESQEAFVEMMNGRAATAGCTNTYFSNVYGLKDGSQHTTARDFGKILVEALKNEGFQRIFETVNYKLPEELGCSQMLYTANEQLVVGGGNYDERITGGKVTAISSGVYSAVCTAEAEAGRYLCIVFSVQSNTGPYTTAKKLLNFGYKNFAVQKVLEATSSYDLFSVRNGENGVVVGFADNAYALLPVKYDRSLLHFVTIEDKKQLSAPVENGESVGTLQICYDTTVVARVQLLAQHDVQEKGTTIQTVAVSGQSSAFWNVMKWIIRIVLIAAFAAAIGLVVLRQINVRRYRKRNAGKGSARKEVANGVE